MNPITKETLQPAPTAPFTLSLFILTGIIAISLASIFIRLTDAAPLVIATYRVTIAAMLIGPVFVRRHFSSKQHWHLRIALSTLLAGGFLAFHFVFWITSLSRTSVASSVTLVSSTPLFVALFSYLWLREKPGILLSAGIACTILGSGLVAGTDFTLSMDALTGDLLAILGAIMAAGYLIAGKFARQSLSLPTYTFCAYGSAGVVLLISCLVTGTKLYGFSKETYVFLLLLALVPQLVGHTTFNWALKFLSPTTVSVLILGEPVGATLLAYLIFGESVSWLKGCGLVLLGAGITLSSIATPKSDE